MKLIFVSFILFTAMPAHAEPELAVRHENYKIEGSTIEELSGAMKLKAPFHLGEHFASTRWNVIWEYKAGGQQGEGCRITSSNVKLDVVFSLPEWQAFENSDEKTRKKWEKFIKKLQRHEDGHMKIGLEAARGVEKILNGIGKHSSCQEIKQLSNQSAESLIASKRQQEIRYDKLTRHGKWQGATLKHKKEKKPPENLSIREE